MKRIAIVEVADVFIEQILKRGTEATEVVADPLPPDAQLVAVDFDGRTIRLKFVSDSFAPVPEGQEIPKLAPKYAVKAARKGYGP